MEVMSEPPCAFCSIVVDPGSAETVLADDVVVAFLDRAPVFKGHVLVVPRRHVVTLPDLEPSAVGPFFERVRAIADAVPRALGADGTFVAINNVVSQSVAHLHVHVVPRRRKDGLRGFFWPRQRYDGDEARSYATAIARELGPDALEVLAVTIGCIDIGRCRCNNDDACYSSPEAVRYAYVTTT
jgi:histidine triad (HIT) family protein